MYLQDEAKEAGAATIAWPGPVTRPASGQSDTEPHSSAPGRALRALLLGFKYFGVMLFFLLKYLALRSVAPRSQAVALRGRVCLQCLFSLGPLYIKMGQVMATQTRLFGDDFTRGIKGAFDRAPTSPESYVRRLVMRAFGEPPEQLFSQFCFAPIASGSIAQVHRARLRDGREVAVKLIKHGVRNEVEAGLLLLGTLISLAELLYPPFRRHTPRAHFDEIARQLRAQTDLRSEAINQGLVADNFTGHPYVKVPRVVAGLVRREILVMDFIEGIPSYRADEVALDNATLAERLQTVFNTMPYFHGLFHLDPHPGNVSFTPGGGVILYDFGLVGHLTERDRWALSGFYYACIRKQWRQAAERFLKQFAIGRADLLRQEACLRGFEQILQEHFEVRTREWSTLAFVNQAGTLLRRYGARFSTNLSGLASALLTGEGFLTLVNPAIDLWENARLFTDQSSPFISDDVKARFDRHFRRTSPRSMARRDAARSYLIAPTHLDRYCFPSEYPLIAAQGEGCRVTDIDGNVYIDLSCGYGPNILGYAHPTFTQALQAASCQGSINAMASEAELDLAHTLCDALPAAERVIFCNSGTEAFIMAARICRALSGRLRIAKFEGHFHGFSDQGLVSSYFRQDGTLERPIAIEGTTGCDPNAVNSTVVLQYGHEAAFDTIREHRGELACVIIEPLMAALVRCDVEFLRRLRALCTELAIPLIFDEVVTGFRVDYGGVQTRYDIHPDLTCLGKVVGGGLPLGAVAGRADFIDIARTSKDPFTDIEKRTFVGGTMSGNSVATRTGLACLRHLQANRWIYAELERKTERLAEGMRSVASELGIALNVRALHSIFSISFGYQARLWYRDHRSGTNFKANIALSYYMRKHGVYVPEMHTMLLNAAHGDADIDQVIAAFRRAALEMIDDRILLTQG